MEKINVDKLFPDEERYKRERLDYIAEYEVYEPGGFFSSGRYVKQPQVAEARWNRSYPNGFVDWREKEGRVAYSDLKVFADTINQIIDKLP